MKWAAMIVLAAPFGMLAYAVYDLAYKTYGPSRHKQHLVTLHEPDGDVTQWPTIGTPEPCMGGGWRFRNKFDGKWVYVTGTVVIYEQ